MIRQIAFSIILIVILSIGVMFAVNTNKGREPFVKLPENSHIAEPDSTYQDGSYVVK